MTAKEDDMRDVARGDVKQGRLDHLANPPRDYRPERFAQGYGGQHDDCIATIPHYHDRPYQPGDWSATPLMPCPACHHPEHDPGACPDCPRCELHIDETLIWLSRVAREDYDEFVEAIEADAIKAAISDLIPKLHRSLRGRGLALWEIEDALRIALNEPVEVLG
jgi:hypothetical protein